MTEFIENLFAGIFGDNVVLATILIAIVPIVELKGAIPFSMSAKIWGGKALSSWSALAFGLLGSSLIVPVLALIYIPLINWLKSTKLFKNLALKIENKVNKQKQKIENKVDSYTVNTENNNVSKDSNEISNLKETKESTVSVEKEQIANIEEQNNKSKATKTKYDKVFFIKLLSVFLFVSVPLPFTGVWTGACLAVVLGLGFWWTCASVIGGNLVAGLIITFLSSLFGENVLIFFYIIMAVIVIFLIASLIVNAFKKKNKENKVQ